MYLTRLSEIGAYDPQILNQVSATIDHGDWFDFKFVGGPDEYRTLGTWTIKSLSQFVIVMNFTAARGETDGSFQKTVQWLKDNNKIPEQKANKWLGYWNSYWTAVWNKEHAGSGGTSGEFDPWAWLKSMFGKTTPAVAPGTTPPPKTNVNVTILAEGVLLAVALGFIVYAVAKGSKGKPAEAAQSPIPVAARVNPKGKRKCTK